MSFDPDYPPRLRPRPAAKPSALPVLLAVLVSFLVGAALLYWLAPRLGRQGPATDPDAAARAAAPGSPPDRDEAEAIALFKGAKDSVVSVDTVAQVRRAGTRLTESQQTGTGSGFAWDDDGRVVTNFHVVRQAAESNGAIRLRVVLADRTAHDAALVGAAPDYDLAVVQLTNPSARGRLKPIKVGTSKDLQVGQKAFAIGNPFGLSMTMTQGIVSALDRQIDSPTDRPIPGAIQTDAPINPGNSGGPLLDKDGRLIGVNTAIVNPGGGSVGGNVGIGFAIPVDLVNPIVTEIVRTGRALRPSLGVRLVPDRVVRGYSVSAGAMIGEVEPNSPAAQAGLKGVSGDRRAGRAPVLDGDLIVAVDGQAVTTSTDLGRLIAGHKVGDKVKLKVQRGDDDPFEVEVTLVGA